MTTTIDDLLTGWAEAERTADRQRLDGLLADDFVGVGPIGFVLDKGAWLRRFDMGLRYDSLALDDVAIHPHDAATIVVAHQHATGTAGDQPTPSDLRVSFTIVVDGDDKSRLRIAAMQYSFIGMPGVAR